MLRELAIFKILGVRTSFGQRTHWARPVRGQDSAKAGTDKKIQGRFVTSVFKGVERAGPKRVCPKSHTQGWTQRPLPLPSPDHINRFQSRFRKAFSRRFHSFSFRTGIPRLRRLRKVGPTSSAHEIEWSMTMTRLVVSSSTANKSVALGRTWQRAARQAKIVSRKEQAFVLFRRSKSGPRFLKFFE